MKKKLFAMMLAMMMTASALTACGGEETETTEDPAAGGETAVEETVPAEGLPSVEEVMSFIENDVYSQAQDFIPMMTMSIELDLEDPDSIAYYTGLTDTTGIDHIVVSESGVGSFAYSFIYVMTDGTNTADIQTMLGQSVDPIKWVCVQADKIASVQLDSDIVLIMGAPEQVDAIMGAVTTAAAEKFVSVGDVVNVLG
ncbi:MAG: hypothetical protein IJ480_07665 [Clostridia bacterium]|nr:hypothetical protein [Clostridia bacterium]